MSDEKKQWDQPTNLKAAAPTEAGELAKKHGISTDRAQMLIDRLGHDPVRLAAEAKKLSPKPR